MNLPNVSLAIHLFACLLSPPIYEQRFFHFCPLIYMTFPSWPNWRFSSHNPKTFHNILIHDISHAAGQIRKNAASRIRLAALENRIHLLSNSLFVYCRDCYFFSDTNISQILSLVISKNLPICLHLFSKKAPGARLQVIPARLQASLWRSHLSRQSIRRPSPIGDPYSFFRGSVPFHRHPTVSNGGRTSTGTVAWVLDLAL